MAFAYVQQTSRARTASKLAMNETAIGLEPCEYNIDPTLGDCPALMYLMLSTCRHAKPLGSSLSQGIRQ